MEIITEKKNGIGTLTINSGGDLNLISRKTIKELADQAVVLDLDDSIKAIVIRGSSKAFSAGIDATDMANNLNTESVEIMHENFARIANLKKPMIAAVSGYALGIGCQIALSCDIILAADNAQFGQPDISVGLVPGFGATQLLTKAAGKAKTMEMVLTGRAMTASEAESVGLVSRIVPLVYLFDEAQNVAGRIAAMSEWAVTTAKELIKTSVGGISLEDGIEIENQVFKNTLESESFAQSLSRLVKK